MSPDHWSESDYCHQMSLQRLTESEATVKLGELCYCIQREVREPISLELLIWQLIMSMIAHVNNKIMWTDENTAQSECLHDVQVHDFVSSFLIAKETSTDWRVLEVHLTKDTEYSIKIKDIHILRAPNNASLSIHTQISIGYPPSSSFILLPFFATVNHSAPDLYHLFSGYLKDKDIDFEFIQRLTWDHHSQDYHQPIVVQPPVPIPSISSAVATFNSQESQHPGENQSLMTEARVAQPFIPSPPSSSDQSHWQSTTAVKTTSLLSGETSEHTSIYHTASETLLVCPPCPPPPPPPPPSDSLLSYNTAQYSLTEVINLQSIPPWYLSPDVGQSLQSLINRIITKYIFPCYWNTTFLSTGEYTNTNLIWCIYCLTILLNFCWMIYWPFIGLSVLRLRGEILRTWFTGVPHFKRHSMTFWCWMPLEVRNTWKSCPKYSPPWSKHRETNE